MFIEIIKDVYVNPDHVSDFGIFPGERGQVFMIKMWEGTQHIPTITLDEFVLAMNREYAVMPMKAAAQVQKQCGTCRFFKGNSVKCHKDVMAVFKHVCPLWENLTPTDGDVQS